MDGSAFCLWKALTGWRNLYYVQLLFEMGVRLMGLPGIMRTGADGALEREMGIHGTGKAGRGMPFDGHHSDVSHLSQAGFWELVELTKGPIIASHSNAYSVCQHPRNLNDEQIRALIALNGMIGITFVPWFIRAE